MANERAPDNIIFQFRTQVDGKDDPKVLAANIEKTGEAYDTAQSKVNQFETGVAKSVASWKAAREEQAKAAVSVKGYAEATLKAAGSVNTMRGTVEKAQGSLKTLVGVDKEAAGFLRPFITRAEAFGKAATKTGGDLEFLKKQAKDLAAIPTPAVQPGAAPGAFPGAQATAEALKTGTTEVKAFADAMLQLSANGTITFDELKAAALGELAILKEVNAEAAKTPQGQAALAVQLDTAQKEALDLLVTMKVITGEQRKVLEQSTQLRNGARQNPTATTAPSLVAPEVQKQAEAIDNTAQAIALTETRAGALVERITEMKDQLAAFVKRGKEAEQLQFDPGPKARLLIQDITEAQQQLAGLELPDTTKFASAAQRALEPIQLTGKEIEDMQKKVVALETKQKSIPKTWTSLRREVQQAKAEVDRLMESARIVNGEIEMTPQLQAALVKAGELQDRFEDLKGTVDAFNPDKKFLVFTNVIQNVAGAFTAAQGALALFGIEGEGVEKSLLKVQSALAFTQGLQALFGGLRDNLKNLRLVLLANAGAARTLAVAEGQAAAGATTQAAATSGLSGVLLIARNAMAAFWAAMVANPIGIIVAAIGVLILTLYQLATAEDEARVKADDLLGALDRVSKARMAQQATNQRNDTLDNEARALREILDLEQQRAAIPSSYSDDRKALENLRIDEAIAAVERRQRVEQQRIDATAFARTQRDAQDELLEVTGEVEELYKRAGQTFIETEGAKGKAALQRAAAQLNMTREEQAQSITRAAVNDKLTEEELADLDKLEERREELEGRIKAASDDRVALSLKERNALIQDQTELTKATQREAELRTKIAQDQIIRGTISALQKEQQRLLDIITKKATIQSPEFFKAIEQYKLVSEELKKAQDFVNATAPDVFQAGSMNDLNQELAFLKEQLNRLPESAEDFDVVRAAVAELEAAIAALNDAMKPTDTKAETTRRLAELDEEKRHILAMADLDAEAAATLARNAGKSEADIRKIEEASKQQRLKLEIDFERKRLEILIAAGKDKEGEVRAQLNKLAELEAQLTAPTDTSKDDTDRKERIDKIRTLAAEVAQAGIDAWQAWTDAQTRSFDQQIANQRQRISEVMAIADQGNAEVLQREKDRLEQMVQARRKAAERNAAIAQIEAAANAVVAITRAAAEGGGLLSAFTIASTLIALTAGIVQARSMAADAVPTQGFYRGTKFVDRAGKYAPGVDTVPAKLTRGERVVDAITSAHNRTLFDGVQDNNKEAIRRGLLLTAARYGLGDVTGRLWGNRPISASKLLTHIPGGRMAMKDMLGDRTVVVLQGKQEAGFTDKQVAQIVTAIENQPRTKVKVDRDGLAISVEQSIRRSNALRNRL